LYTRTPTYPYPYIHIFICNFIIHSNDGIIDHIYGIDVNFISFSYQESNPYLEGISEDFNEYSKANGLDINLNRVLLSPANTTVYLGDYAATIKSILKKNKDRYDLFMMSALYTNTFESYTSDLRLYVSSETLKNYSKGVGSTIGVINDKIIGLVNIYIYILYNYI